MRFTRVGLVAAVVVVAAAGAGVAVATAPSGNPQIEQHLPAGAQLDNLPDRVGVAGPDGTLAGYVDRDLLLALTRDLPLPQGVSPNGPFPVYDEDGKVIGSYQHDTGFTPAGQPAPDGPGPMTPTTVTSASPIDGP